MNQVSIRGIRKALPWVLMGLAMSFLMLVGGTLALADGPDAATDQLFQQKCAACHSMGQGASLGPDLKGIAGQRDRDWLIRWLMTPDKMLAEKDPIAVKLLQEYRGIAMPNLGLTQQQAESLVVYMGGSAAATAPAEPGAPAVPSDAAPQPAAPPPGSVTGGKGLFIGSTAFQNGGPPCLACHSTAGLGALGGGAMGPDLTTTYSRLGDAIATWPDNFPPMQAIYTAKPLTAQERADLSAFFKASVADQRPAQSVVVLFGLAVLGILAFLGLAHLLWRRRLGAVRRPLVARQSPRSL